MEYGNCPYAAANSKPGEKKLRTRIRVGFSAQASVEAVQDYLHTGLRQLGRGAGCYPSPLQFGEIVKIGSCSFIPAEVNFSAYAKELMRLFDFEVPIGIKMDWVSIPYTGRAKYDERSPGVTSPHCFTRRIHAKRVDRTLRSILHPATAKPDFPFAAPATYISDWKLAQQGLLSVKAYGPVKDAILTLISKLQDYYILTEVLYPGIDFTGMFKFATTRLYGSCTLFKLLLSIKATPAQADQASTAAKDRPPTPADDDSSEEEDDESQEGAGSLSGPFTKVTKKKVKKKKSLSSNNLENHFLNDLSPAQRKLAEATDRKLKNDIDRHKAGPLFLMILPGEMEGSYIFVCRKKYAHHLAIDSQPPTQNNEVSPDRSDFTTPPKKRKSKDSSMTKRSVDRSKAGLKPPTKSTRTSTSVHFQQPKQRSRNTSQVQVDTTQMEGDTTTAVSQDKSLSSLTAASPGGVHPFFLPSPSGKSGTKSAKLPSSAGRGAPRSAAGP
ncbi:unnamed protein product [Cylindrotheca closterium]|uniref:Uncharacterized protein n=1 Tax=Cylindrotheca closterium TaxID=2856 RepID=A0AAD2JQ32_9STRA|nr:unnamed protein product [Cylindrotheca closterium]